MHYSQSGGERLGWVLLGVLGFVCLGQRAEKRFTANSDRYSFLESSMVLRYCLNMGANASSCGAKRPTALTGYKFSTFEFGVNRTKSIFWTKLVFLSVRI